MAKTIKFGVHRNPKKDAEGRDTYHVRHETDFALNQEYIISQVKTYNAAEASHINPVIGVLREQIVEILTDNHNVHIEGLGNFYLKLGFRERTGENGQPVLPHFTDPSQITGNDVVAVNIGFTADEELLKQLLLDQFFETHDRLLSRDMRGLFGLTQYMADKWLDELCTQAPPYLRFEKVANVRIFYRR